MLGNFTLNGIVAMGAGPKITRIDEERYAELATQAVIRLNQLATFRAPLNILCEEAAQRVAPAWVGSFNFAGIALPTPYMKNTENQVDATGMLALDRFMAICDSLLSPRNQMWHGLKPWDDHLSKSRGVKEWFYEANRTLFKYRYAPVSNFSANNQAVYHSLGLTGNGVNWVDHFYDKDNRRKALRYKNIPFGEIYLEQNHQGLYNGCIRIIRYTAQQAWTAYADCQSRLPEIVMQALKIGSTRQFVFLQRVCPNDQYDPEALDYRGKPWSSYHICYDTKTFLREGGYYSLPFAASRYHQGPNEQDGRGVAHDVLPSLKTLDAEKRIFLKTGHRAADPVILLKDDGLINLNARPGAQNKGGWTEDGKPAVGTLPVGDVQITKEMMAEEKGLINDAFLVALFQIMTEKNGMTATEVVERINEKGILIAPTLGRQEGEYFGPMIDREMVCLADMGLLPPMPPALLEAGGHFQVTYNSPLSKAMRAQEASGFIRTLQVAQELVGATQDQAPLDVFNFDKALPEIAEIQGTPITWMATDEEIKGKRDARAKQQQDQQQVAAAPAAAAMIKAQAAAAAKGQQVPAPGA